MIKSKKVIIVAHYLLYGAAHALTDYLISNDLERLFCIFLPLSSQRKTFLIQYNKSKQKKLIKRSEKISQRFFNLGPIDYLFDIIQVLLAILSKDKYDTYIGFDALNCLTGIFLKKIGRVKNVIFYSIDFVPIRFNNRLLNYIYHQVEIYCVKQADQIWNVSPRIAEGRQKFLNLSIEKYPQLVVPIGVWNSKIKKRTSSKVKKNQILFLGHLLEKQGVQKVIESLPLIINKIHDLKFVIIGGGEYLEALQMLVKRLKLDEYVNFTGWIKDRNKIDEMISESAVAVATYKPEKKQLYNFTYYADPTKLKDYLAAGLPVILTDISYNAKIIAEKECGILVQYEDKSISDGILKLLTNQKLLEKYRINALSYAKEFDWSKIFKKIII